MIIRGGQASAAVLSAAAAHHKEGLHYHNISENTTPPLTALKNSAVYATL